MCFFMGADNNVFNFETCIEGLAFSKGCLWCIMRVLLFYINAFLALFSSDSNQNYVDLVYNVLCS